MVLIHQVTLQSAGLPLLFCQRLTLIVRMKSLSVAINGQSRVICGYHWQSDVDAARLISAAVVARLHAEPAFQEQLAKAKKEFAKLKKEGKIAKSTFKTAN